jgi:ParB family transcriptional regulator, chromosome partitioning protein
MAEKRRLGRGLDALIPDLSDLAAPGDVGGAEGLRELPLQAIELNPRQPRQTFDPARLQELADSIAESGVIQPIVVRPRGDQYELVVGERRLRASLLAGKATIPALVRDVPDDRMLELALVENIQRADLNAIERAEAVEQMIAELGLTQEQVGRRIGFQRSSVANMLRLLELPETVRDMVSRGTLSAGHARALLPVSPAAAQERLARQIERRGLSVREAERLAARESLPVSQRRGAPLTAHLASLEEVLRTSLGVRVDIRPKRKGGRIVVHFRDTDEFERLCEQISGQDAFDVS